MTRIYDQYDAAFAKVSAYVVLKDGNLVARIAFKHPREGAGRLYAYVHWLGVEMVRGYASGGGYDKRSAACSSAAHRHCDNLKAAHPDDNARAFWLALEKAGGPSWENELHHAGFVVAQAV